MTANSSAIERALACLEAGDWDGAHKLVQDDSSPEAAWVHAHLHRVEGDLSNARYWYRKAGRPETTANFDEERRNLAGAQSNAKPPRLKHLSPPVALAESGDKGGDNVFSSELNALSSLSPLSPLREPLLHSLL